MTSLAAAMAPNRRNVLAYLAMTTDALVANWCHDHPSLIVLGLIISTALMWKWMIGMLPPRAFPKEQARNADRNARVLASLLTNVLMTGVFYVAFTGVEQVGDRLFPGV